MQENFELVQRGCRILVGSVSGFIGQQIHRLYRNNWWNEVLNALYDQRDLPCGGSCAELVDSLDVANCIRLIDRKQNDVFRTVLPMAERALDTMALLCNVIAPLYDTGKLIFARSEVSFVEPISNRSRHAKQAMLFAELRMILSM